MPRLATLAALGTVALIHAPEAAQAAAGSIDFKTLNVSLSSKNGRPVAPILIVTGSGKNWSVGGTSIAFDLRIYASVNAFSSIWRVRVGVPGLTAPGGSWTAHVAGWKEGAQKLEITSTRHAVPGAALGTAALAAQTMCAQAQAGGRTGTFDLPFRFELEVEVAAARGIVAVENRFKTFNRSVMGILRCVSTSNASAHGEPQRTPGAPQRTPGAPKRTAPEFQAISAELGFAKARNTWQCPLEVRVSFRILSKGPGTAKVYIVKQDGKGTLSQPYAVKVEKQVGGSWVGVHRHTIKVLNPIAEKYRIVVAGQDGRPAVESAWVPLEVSCKPTAPGGKKLAGG
jgi:hypothetical protein